MSNADPSQEQIPLLQRVRCRHCQCPLVQLYQGDLLYTLHQPEEQILSQLLPAYAYRRLTDPTLLLCCPQCGAALSPATVVVVLPRTSSTLAPKTAPPTNDR